LRERAVQRTLLDAGRLSRREAGFFMDAESALRDHEFAALMDKVGPFEARPQLAIAVSGGRDSLCLALLLHRWVRRRRGRITALTVDHGLRPESAAEAAQVHRWLAVRDIAHRTLHWQRDAEAQHFAGGLQAAAREARYRLLCGACRDLGILHLALAHQRDDQAETLLLRLSRGSGLDGLAAIAPVTEREGVRLLRPLLPVPRARLAVTLQACRQDWIDDPSNENDAHTRIRLRRLLPSLADAAVTPERLAAAAAALGRARQAMEDGVAALLTDAVEIDPAGYLRLDAGELARAPAEVSQRALARCLMAIGGSAYGPRLERLIRLHDRIVTGLGGGATLAGCRIVRHRDRLVICRELAAVAPPFPLPLGETIVWDGRFAIARSGREVRPRRLQVAALGEEGYRAVLARRPDLRAHPIPALARPVLPAIWPAGTPRRSPVAVPHLDYRQGNPQVSVGIDFVPIHALAGSRFTVA
jgi:tRNA(Ile)-lysidine synthase